MSGSVRTSSSTDTARSSVFSESVTYEVKNKASNSCWACPRGRPQVCHVVPRDDLQTQLWIERGLIDFRISSHLNGIALCGSCHTEFDDAYDPWFSFMPADLDFFINFELRDRERRRQVALSGQAPRRRVPNANSYKQHQVDSGIIDSDSIGGLYTPYYLAPVSHRVSTFSTPRPWHGAPLASLRRAFLLLGSGRAQSIDKDQLQKLWRLKELYFSDDEIAVAENSPVETPSTPKRPAEEASDMGGSPAKRSCVEINRPGSGEAMDVDNVFASITEDNLKAHNMFNSSFTANDLMRRFTSTLRESPPV
ncbi:hypothetical protein ASPCAL12753 [Aspergillus calidoustus]|uniref:HNH nuclease domain-containing protein n=1 Tax=Aspergillus calidoustus TaxID=454130 RepID=A0A0U5H6H0_ASPCI|nr:hypothetical protein ASPCAL12753 [Aspergillus calidoustus]